MTTKNFKSAAGYKKAQAFIHMHVHEGPSKHPYKVEIKGKAHKVEHEAMDKAHSKAMARVKKSMA